MSMFQAPGGAERDRHREHAPLPLGVERRLVGLGHDRAEAVRAAHVVRAVHSTPVPIIASRVTMPASRSSSQPSVPAGRIGTTR